MITETGLTTPINALQFSFGPCTVGAECDVTSNVTCYATSSFNRSRGGDVVDGASTRTDNEFDVLHCGSQWMIHGDGAGQTERERPRSENEPQRAARELTVNITLVVYMTVFAVGFVGNTLVIIVIIKSVAREIVIYLLLLTRFTDRVNEKQYHSQFLAWKVYFLPHNFCSPHCNFFLLYLASSWWIIAY